MEILKFENNIFGNTFAVFLKNLLALEIVLRKLDFRGELVESFENGFII